MSKEIRIRFLEELQNLIGYYAKEYELSYIEMVGCLHMQTDHISKECREGKDDSGEQWKK